MSRWLVLIQRGREDLYAYLQTRLSGVPGVEVILDHRTQERRTRVVGIEPERRTAERRQALPAWDRDLWTGLGFRLVRRE